MQLTAEQQAVVAAATHSSAPHLTVNGYAGAAKTTTMLAVAKAMNGRRGRAFFFNKAMALDMREKIERQRIAGLEASTLHSLAYGNMVSIYGRKRIGQPLRGPDVVRHFNLFPIEVAGVSGLKAPLMPDGSPEGSPQPKKRSRKKPTSALSMGGVLRLTAAQVAYICLRSFERWCNSEEADLELKHMHAGDFEISADSRDRVRAAVHPFARRLKAAILDPNGSLPVPHHGYLKAYVEKLAAKELNPPRCDYLIGDEFQDSNGVTMKFVAIMRQANAQVIIAGDPFQQIYGWRGSINAMSSIQTDRTLELTQSFRFGPQVAALATAALSRMGSPVVLQGDASKTSVIEATDGPIVAAKNGNAIICRSNAGVIEAALAAIGQGHECFIPKAAVMQDRLTDILALKKGRSAVRTELRQFQTYDEFCEFIALDEGAVEWKLLDKLLGDYGEDRLMSLLDCAKDQKQCNVTVTTAHGAKGLEWPYVVLWQDFPDLENGNVRRDHEEEMRLLYVAVTRAKQYLDISRVPLLCSLHAGEKK